MKCVYKDIAKNLDKEELEKYYLQHTNNEVCEHFNFHKRYLHRILKYLGIKSGSFEKYSNINSRYVCTDSRNEKLSNSLREHKTSEQTRMKISASQKGKKILYGDKISQTLKQKYASKEIVVWNKGKSGVQLWSSEQREKYFNTLKEKGWFKKSKEEDMLYSNLCEKYGKENVLRQYSDSRYPFRCDFYIKSDDLFIELNRFWHHGPHRFDSNNEKDIELLSVWQEKSKTSKQYANAIKVWTVLDVEKFRVAENNNLNYIAIYDRIKTI